MVTVVIVVIVAIVVIVVIVVIEVAEIKTCLTKWLSDKVTYWAVLDS